MKMQYLLHKHGGRITAIHSIEHATYKGVASWFFRGDVEWVKSKGGGKSEATEIPPYAVCYDESIPKSKAECNKVFDLLSEYLQTHGEWHDQKEMRDGRMVSWTPKQKEAALAL